MPVKVLLVDDSAIIRGLMAQALAAYPDIFIAGRASNGSMAIDLARDMQPDVIVLDIEMPVMDGITALPEILKVSPGSKIIMASTLTLRNAAISVQALTLGAADYLAKPSAKSGGEVDIFYRELVGKILALGGAAPLPAPAVSQPVPPVVLAAPAVVSPLIAGDRLNPAGIAAVAIACSTGGPQALTAFFTQIKGQLTTVPIFITQHMPPTFTMILAEQLGKTGGRSCHEGKDGNVVEPGCAYVAPGDFHMVAEKDASGRIILRLNQNPPENFCRPAADPMLRSLSAIYGDRLAAIVLTGMGQDGMEGCKDVVNNGGSVVAQDQDSCVVYGMPKAVADKGLCKAVLPLAEIGALLIAQTGEDSR